MQYTEVLEKLARMGPELRTGKLAGPGGMRKFSLDHIRTLLERLGNPQREFASVLIAGTNGKGSTSGTLASIAAAGGLGTAPGAVHLAASAARQRTHPGIRRPDLAGNPGRRLRPHFYAGR